MSGAAPDLGGLGPAGGGAWVDAANVSLLVDLYELTMAQAYEQEGLRGTAVFELSVRELPPQRNVLVACGLDDALRFLERLSFDPGALEALRSLGFAPAFLERLARLRFTGDVWALPEGTPFFAGEPVLRVSAPLVEAQIIETFLLNAVHFQTLAASKALRVVTAAAGRAVVDFGLRRMHGADAGLKSARAFHVAGVSATSNVLAARTYGLTAAGTMAHSYVQAHEDEARAFRAFARGARGAVLLVDTYDTLDGVRRVAQLARELGPAFGVRAIRLDSGDLAALAREARAMLDAAGLRHVQIFASGGLDEHRIAALLEGGAPIDGFGVGTRMGVSADAPYLDVVYKLVELDGRGRMKLSAAKATLPGAKAVFRVEGADGAIGDLVTVAGASAREALAEARDAADAGNAELARVLRDDAARARRLMVAVMEAGSRTAAAGEDLAAARRRCAEEVARLPARVRASTPAEPPYPVWTGARLLDAARRLGSGRR